MRLTKIDREVLDGVRACNDDGGFARACDGKYRPAASKLYVAGLLQWHGVTWGSHFYSITDKGRAALSPPPSPIATAESEQP